MSLCILNKLLHRLLTALYDDLDMVVVCRTCDGGDEADLTGESNSVSCSAEPTEAAAAAALVIVHCGR